LATSLLLFLRLDGRSTFYSSSFLFHSTSILLLLVQYKNSLGRWDQSAHWPPLLLAATWLEEFQALLETVAPEAAGPVGEIGIFRLELEAGKKTGSQSPALGPRVRVLMAEHVVAKLANPVHQSCKERKEV
jgi:hypothetical protein